MSKRTPSRQLGLFPEWTEPLLKQHLEAGLGRPVSLTLTDNSTSLLSMRTRDGAARVRLHRMFLNADRSVLGEIVSYLKNGKGALPNCRGFVRDNREHLRGKPPRKVPVRTAGKVHDLRALYDENNREYFDGRVEAAITWGTRSPRRAVKKRTVGSYSEQSNTIRINPVLDRKDVPRCYVSFIIYHEMLHASQGTAIRGKRRSIHSREFRKREKLFKDYEEARAWENRN
jgi:predicted metal-dependent hydrolase